MAAASSPRSTGSWLRPETTSRSMQCRAGRKPGQGRGPPSPAAEILRSSGWRTRPAARLVSIHRAHQALCMDTRRDIPELQCAEAAVAASARARREGSAGPPRLVRASRGAAPGGRGARARPAWRGRRSPADGLVALASRLGRAPPRSRLGGSLRSRALAASPRASRGLRGPGRVTRRLAPRPRPSSPEGRPGVDRHRAAGTAPAAGGLAHPVLLARAAGPRARARPGT